MLIPSHPSCHSSASELSYLQPQLHLPTGLFAAAAPPAHRPALRPSRMLFLRSGLPLERWNLLDSLLQASSHSTGAPSVVEKLELGKKMQALCPALYPLSLLPRKLRNRQSRAKVQVRLQSRDTAPAGQKATPPTKPALLQLSEAFPPEGIISGEDQSLPHCGTSFNGCV